MFSFLDRLLKRWAAKRAKSLYEHKVSVAGSFGPPMIDRGFVEEGLIAAAEIGAGIGAQMGKNGWRPGQAGFYEEANRLIAMVRSGKYADAIAAADASFPPPNP